MTDKENKEKNPNWGGEREGAGRPPTGRKLRQVWATDEEYSAMMKVRNAMRAVSQVPGTERKKRAKKEVDE